jgi:hypothetical protein
VVATLSQAREFPCGEWIGSDAWRKSAQEDRKMSMSISPEHESHPEMEPTGPSPTERKLRTIGIVLAVVMAIAVAEGFFAWSLNSRVRGLESAMQTQFGQQAETLQVLQEQASITDEDFARLQQELTTAQNHLGNTQSELRKARVAADQFAKQQKEAADQFANKLGQIEQEQASTKGAVGGLSTDMSGVKQEVTATKQDLAATRSELQRAIGDLGVQSGLIATNRTELAELRERGERDYFEFDLRKVKQPQRFGGNVGLQLKKVDVKRQKYTVDLITDDKRIEKKDKNVNEPVQFYQQGYRQPTEVVVNQILKDRIVGYIAVPKGRSNTQMSGVPSQPTAPGSGT